MKCFITAVGSLYERSLLYNKRPQQSSHIMPRVRGDTSLGGILGILEVDLLPSNGKVRSSTRVASVQDHDVRIHCEHELVSGERRAGSENDDTILISVKIFMSRTQSFGNVGFYLPFGMHIDQLHMKQFHVRVVLSIQGEERETFQGTFSMIRPDVAAKLLALPENKRLTSTTIDLKDNTSSARFFSKIRNLYLSQGNEEQVPDLEKQAKFGQTNVHVVMELLSEILTDLREDGRFPPSQSAGHTHFTLPNTRPLALDSIAEDTTKTLVMRLLSFVYTRGNDIFPEIAKSGFYLIGNTGSVTCTKCECEPHVDGFQGMEPSEFNQMHNFGCYHRKCSSEDQLGNVSYNHLTPDIPDVLSGRFLRCFLSLQERSSVSPCQLNEPMPQSGDESDHHRPTDTKTVQSGKISTSLQRSNVVTIVERTPTLKSVPAFSSSSFDADTFMHNPKLTYVPALAIPPKPVWSAFELSSKRSATFYGSTIAFSLKSKLVENGFFCQRNMNIQTFCCDVPFDLDVDTDPATVHARNSSSCPRAISRD